MKRWYVEEFTVDHEEQIADAIFKFLREKNPHDVNTSIVGNGFPYRVIIVYSIEKGGLVG